MSQCRRQQGTQAAQGGAARTAAKQPEKAGARASDGERRWRRRRRPSVRGVSLHRSARALRSIDASILVRRCTAGQAAGRQAEVRCRLATWWSGRSADQQHGSVGARFACCCEWGACCASVLVRAARRGGEQGIGGLPTITRCIFNLKQAGTPVQRVKRRPGAKRGGQVPPMEGATAPRCFEGSGSHQGTPRRLSSPPPPCGGALRRSASDQRPRLHSPCDTGPHNPRARAPPAAPRRTACSSSTWSRRS